MLKKTLAISFCIFFLFLLIRFTMARYQNSNETDSVKNDSNVTEEMTEIIEYKQTYIPDEKRTGDCWTSSIAASTNETAYRCNVGEHQIIDPCFKTEDARVVCDVDPERQGSGFEGGCSVKSRAQASSRTA